MQCIILVINNWLSCRWMCFLELDITENLYPLQLHGKEQHRQSKNQPLNKKIFKKKNTWTVLWDLSNTVFVSANRKCISVLKWCSVLHYRQLTSKFTSIFTFTDWRLLYKVNILLISPHSLDIIVCFVKPSWFKSIAHAAIPEAACFYSTLSKPEL